MQDLPLPLGLLGSAIPGDKDVGTPSKEKFNVAILLLLFPIGILAYLFAFNTELFQAPFNLGQGTPAVEQELQAINSNIEALRGDFANLQNRVVSVNELEDTRGEIKALDLKLKAMQTRINTLEREVAQSADSADKISELFTLVKKMTDEVDKMQKEIDALKAGTKSEPEMQAPKEQVPQEEPKEQDEVKAEEPEPEKEAPKEETVKVKLLTLSLPNTQYAPGEEIIITGRTDPNNAVKISILDENSVEKFSKVVKANDAGKYKINYLVSQNMPAGFYKVTASSGDRQVSALFSVKIPAATYAESESGTVTIKADRATYTKGEYISLSGTAPPRSTVTVSISFPSGNESSLNAQVDASGKYRVLLMITLDSSSGKWLLSAKHESEVASIEITVL